MVLFALWWGFRIAQGRHRRRSARSPRAPPRSRAATSTSQVEPHSDDEVGFLVRSFNRMTRDLREARDGVERSNAELDQRRRYMEIVLRNVGAGVVSLDADGRISTINPAAQRLLGMPPGMRPRGPHARGGRCSAPSSSIVMRELARQTPAGPAREHPPAGADPASATSRSRCS